MLRIFILFCAIQFSFSATIRFENEKNGLVYNLEESDSDLLYSDVSTQQDSEVRERLYRQLRQYGVPSDVAHMYVPRGMTVGELLGKDKDKNASESNTSEANDSSSTFDPWSIVWYIGSFGGLIAFFLVISCSEWCCLKSRAAATLAGATGTPRAPRCPPNTTRPSHSAVDDAPPPGYDLFAPPSYDLVFGDEKRKYDVFVVPVHSVTQVGCLENPPQYQEIMTA